MSTPRDVMSSVYKGIDEARYIQGEKQFKDIIDQMSPLRLMKEALEEQVDNKMYSVMALRKLMPSEGRMRIFVSGCYSGTQAEIDENIARARTAVGEIMSLGHFPLAPHLHFAHFENYYPEIDYEYYLQWCFNLIPLCHGIYMTNFWQKSPGAQRELSLATQYELAVYYNYGQIPSTEQVRESWAIFDPD